MIRRLALTALVVVAVTPWALASLGPTDAAGQGPGAATQLVEQMREASSSWSFDGTVALEWRDSKDPKQLRHATVDVAAAYGMVQISAGTHQVIDDLGTTYVLGDRGRTSVLMAPLERGVPAADHAWTLTSRRGPVIAGRPTTVVIATRDGRGPAQRLYIDTETHLFLGREVLDADGRVQRGLRFSTFTVEGGPLVETPTTSTGGPSTSTGRSATLRHVPDGYRAPTSTAGGYVLIAKAKGTDGGVQLAYSDGIFTISVSERQGELDWDSLAEGGTSTTVAGHAARTYAAAGGDVVVWEDDGLVFTCVSDAPMDVTSTMIAGLSPSGRSAIEQAVDFVLGPFGWH